MDKLVAALKNTCTSREKELIKLHYGIPDIDDKTISEIAKEWGLGRQPCAEHSCQSTGQADSPLARGATRYCVLRQVPRF